MGIDSIWIIILAVSTPIASVVGFAIQLRNVKKLRLENDKLNLEIAILMRDQKASESRIIPVSNDEVIKYAHRGNHPLYSMRQEQKINILKHETESHGVGWEVIVVILGAIFLIGYFLYDVYRLGKLVFSMF